MFTKAQLLAHVALLIQPTPEDMCPPEKSVILAAVAALDDHDTYVVYDDQEDEIPQWVYVLDEIQCASWDGSQEGSFGYGGCSMLTSSQGRGLRVWLGGSGLQSATGFQIVTSKCAEIANYRM